MLNLILSFFTLFINSSDKIQTFHRLTDTNPVCPNWSAIIIIISQGTIIVLHLDLMMRDFYLQTEAYFLWSPVIVHVSEHLLQLHSLSKIKLNETKTTQNRAVSAPKEWESPAPVTLH